MQHNACRLWRWSADPSPSLRSWAAMGAAKAACCVPPRVPCAAGARDGALMVWDCRAPARADSSGGEACHAPVITIQAGTSRRAARASPTVVLVRFVVCIWERQAMRHPPLPTVSCGMPAASASQPRCLAESVPAAPPHNPAPAPTRARAPPSSPHAGRARAEREAEAAAHAAAGAHAALGHLPHIPGRRRQPAGHRG